MEAEVITVRDLTKVKKQIYAIQRIIMGLQIQGKAAGSPISMVSDKKLALFKQVSITSSVEGSDIVIEN